MKRNDRAGQSKTAILASIALHSIAFIVLTAVKLYYEEPDVSGEMSVTFVDPQDTKPRRHLAVIRPNILLYSSPQNRSQEQAIARPTHRSSEVFYTDAPQKAFSTVRGVERESFRGHFFTQLPLINRSRPVVSPIGTAVLKETHPPEMQLQPHVMSGRDFLREIPSVQSRPRSSDIMQWFVQTVRRKIESEKRYPLAARKSMAEGRVGVKMTILKDGQLERTEIIESSGYTVLDKAAVESVRRAAPFPPFPKEAKRRRLQMSIYLVFKMM